MAAIGFPGNSGLTMTRNFLKCTLLGRESKIDSSFETQKGMHDHFTKIAKVYRDLRTTDEEPIHLIRNELRDRDATKAIEIGCGAGRYTFLLFQHIPNLTLTCVDANPGMLAELAENLTDRGIADFEIVLGRVEDLELKSESLDCVLSFNAVHHFDVADFISKAGRAIKEEGRIFIYTRTPGQNARSIWGKFFPNFLEMETRLFGLADMERWIDEMDGLHLMSAETFCYSRRSKLDRLLEQVRNRHYSTFSLYTEKELEGATKTFRENIMRDFNDPQNIEWQDENIMYQIGKTSS